MLGKRHVPTVLAILLAVTPQWALGQTRDVIRIDVRPGTEIQSDQLGELLTRSVAVSYPGQVVRATMRLEMISREGGVIATWESAEVETRALDEHGGTYQGRMWITDPGALNERFAPGFGERRKITFGRFIHEEAGALFDGCEDATHALRITMVSDDEQFVKAGQPMLCLNVER